MREVVPSYVVFGGEQGCPPITDWFLDLVFDLTKVVTFYTCSREFLDMNLFFGLRGV